MSEEVKRQCEEVFNYYAFGKNGKVPTSKVADLMKCLGQNPSDDEVKAI